MFVSFSFLFRAFDYNNNSRIAAVLGKGRKCSAQGSNENRRFVNNKIDRLQSTFCRSNGSPSDTNSRNIAEELIYYTALVGLNRR